MRRLFRSGHVGEADVELGTSSLEGDYRCAYCGQPFARLGRFVAHGAHCCTVECVAAYTRHRLHGTQDDHDALEQRYGRRVVCAPADTRLAARQEWLIECRAQLDDDERRVADREMRNVLLRRACCRRCP